MRKNKKEGFIEIKDSKGINHIDLNDICYCKAERSYSIIFLKSGKTKMFCKSLKQLKQVLPSNIFFQCHRSYLINVNEIKSFDFYNKKVIQNLFQIPYSERRIVELFSKAHFDKQIWINEII